MNAARAAAAGACAGLLGCAAILGIQDGTPRDGGAGDAATRCDPQRPFGAPVAVTELDTPGDEALARLSRDELEVYFERIAGSVDLYVATRTSTSQPFGPAAPLASVNTPDNEADPDPSVDGQRLYFASNRDGGTGGIDIWTAARVDGGFASIAPLAGAGSPATDEYPYALANSLYFTSDRTGTFGIYRADLAGASVSNVTLLSPPDAGAELVPVVSDDELLMYFAALGASDAAGDIDIWMATRTATSQPWSAPVQVAELDTTSVDVPSWLSPDLCRLYMASNRGGNFDIYVASRSP